MLDKNNFTQKEILSDRYEIKELVGIGGMSYVYKAYDRKTQTIVAIKVLKDEFVDDDEFLSKFRKEALSSEQIHHENVVSSLDVVEEGRLHYIVLEFLDSITLKKYIKSKGHLSNEETINISLQIAKGLKSAHDKGIIHRDIKPQNILITKDNIAKITDFGIARAISSNTKNISVVGTVHYISPEQAKNENIDFRSDIYSLGCTMYEMITGKVPFDGENPASIIISHLRESIDLPSEFNKDVYKSLEKIILKSTKLLKEERYKNVSELICDLEKALTDKEGTFISQAIYGENDNTVIISDKELKVIKQWSKNYKAGDTIVENALTPKEQAFVDEYLKGKVKLKSRYVWRIVLTLVIAIAIVVVGILTYTFIKTMNNKNVNETKVSTISDSTFILSNIKTSLVGINIDIAKNLLKDYNIDVHIADYVYNDKFENNTIIEVLRDDINDTKTIDVLCSKGKEVIDFTNTTELQKTDIDEMTKLLDEREVTYKIIEINDRYVAKGKIIAVNKPNSKSNNIIITVSKGFSSDDVRTMPDLIGLDIESARTALQDNDLVAGDIYYSSSDKDVGEVIDQSIEANRNVDIGTSVNMTISSGPLGQNIGATLKEQWIGSLQTVYIVADPNTPIVGQDDTQTKTIAVRLKQNTNENIKYKELSQPTEYLLGTSISLVYPRIEGEKGIYTGEVQVVDVIEDRVLTTYPISFKRIVQ